MREIKNEKDLADVFKSGELINDKAVEDNLDLIKEIFKGTIYEIKEEE